jgi:hypothetical protein
MNFLSVLAAGSQQFARRFFIRGALAMPGRKSMSPFGVVSTLSPGAATIAGFQPSRK